MSKPATIELTIDDLKPDCYFQLYNRNTDLQLDISDSDTDVSAKFRALNNTTSSLFAFTVTKHVASLGIIKCVLPTGALAVDAGRYQIEITVDFDGFDQTVIDIFPVRVREEFPDVA